MDVSSQAWEWAKYGTAAGFGALLLAIFRVYFAKKKLPSEIHRTETESLRIDAEAGKVRAEARKIETESEISLAQTVFEMTKQVAAENKTLRTELEAVNKTMGHLIQQSEAKDRALVTVEREKSEAERARDCAEAELARANERLEQLESLAGEK
jgi:chromosome segregation ATPase